MERASLRDHVVDFMSTLQESDKEVFNTIVDFLDVRLSTALVGPPVTEDENGEVVDTLLDWNELLALSYLYDYVEKYEEKIIAFVEHYNSFFSNDPFTSSAADSTDIDLDDGLTPYQLTITALHMSINEIKNITEI